MQLDKDLNLKTLEELIFDESKIVTYIYLSKKLCIHVNDSKSLLLSFINDIRSKKADTGLNITYLISGLSEENKARTTVCSENDIQSVKNDLKTIFFQHIYSISKGLSRVDNLALATVNSFADVPLCLGLVRNDKCIKLSSGEIENCKSNSINEYVTNVPEVSTSKIQPNKKLKQESMDVDEHQSQNEIKVKSESNGNSCSKSPVKKANTKTLSSAKKPEKSIAGFFSKQNVSTKKDTQIKTESKDECKIKNIDDNSLLSKTVGIKKEEMQLETNNKIKEIKKGKEKKAVVTDDKKKSKSVADIKRNSKVDKKRKRVLQVSDSESDDDKNDPFVDDEPLKETIESEDEIPATPTLNTVKVTSGITNPKKRRKVVDKTYTGEDGYILTKKEVVNESCSDDEEAKESVNMKENIDKLVNIKKETSPPKKPEPKKGRKKFSPPEKGKQQTLMNFFKKA